MTLPLPVGKSPPERGVPERPILMVPPERLHSPCARTILSAPFGPKTTEVVGSGDPPVSDADPSAEVQKIDDVVFGILSWSCRRGPGSPEPVHGEPQASLPDNDDGVVEVPTTMVLFARTAHKYRILENAWQVLMTAPDAPVPEIRHHQVPDRLRGYPLRQLGVCFRIPVWEVMMLPVTMTL